MSFLNNFFLPPSTDHLHLIKYIILLIYFIHIPFISLLLGGTFFSVFFRLLAGKDQNSRFWQVSRDFIETLVFRKTAGIILGVLPMLALTLIEGQIFYDADIIIVKFMMITAVLVSIGISLVYFYQSTFKIAEVRPNVQLASGVVGLFALLLAYFVFSVSTSLVLDPGRWAFVNSIWKTLFSWNVVARYVHFLSAALAVSSVAFFFFNFNWRESQKEITSEYVSFLKKLSAGIALTLTIIQPLFLLWNLITLPDQALSMAVFILLILALFIIMLICLTLYRLLSENHIELGKNVFVMFIILLVVMIINDHYARENATENHTYLLIHRAEDVEAQIQAAHTQLLESSVEPDLKLGEKIYNTQCNACHRFKESLVGPAYNVALPKYLNRQEELVNFIRNPYKIDQSYPAMPKLGLNEKEIQSVVAYLFKRLEESK